jgi:hypothetical protein
MTPDQIVGLPIPHEPRRRDDATDFAAYDAGIDPIIGTLFDDFAVLASATHARLDDPRAELERAVLLGAVLHVAQTANRAMRDWVCQTTIEYRGSSTTGDHPATTDDLARALGDYMRVLHSAAERVGRLMPQGSRPGALASDASPAGPSRERTA